jgi:RNA polymerase sigma factor (sigma-70 family)
LTAILSILELKQEDTMMPLTKVQQGLVAENVPLARAIARPHQKAWPSHCDDFESEALLTLVKAGMKFDPAKGGAFPLYARRAIVWAMTDLQRRLYKAKRDSQGGQLGDYPVYDTHDSEYVDYVKDYISKRLTKKQVAVVTEIYINGHTQRETQKILGKCKANVSTLHSRALSMLRGIER